MKEEWKEVGETKKLNGVYQTRIVAQKGNLLKTYIRFNGKETFQEFYALEDIKEQIKNGKAIIIPSDEEFAKIILLREKSENGGSEIK